MQPRRAQVPPNGRQSTTATVRPASRHPEATAEVTPVPITTRSRFVRLALVRSAEAAAVLARAHNDWVLDYCAADRRRGHA
jgi:hypothetical protein